MGFVKNVWGPKMYDTNRESVIYAGVGSQYQAKPPRRVAKFSYEAQDHNQDAKYKWG